MTELKLSIRAIDKLLEYTASGIGSVAGAMIARWKASQHAKAKVITAHGDAEAIKIIALAQTEASQLFSNSYNVQGQVDFSREITQRIHFQEEKRQSNIAAVVHHTASAMADKNVEDHEPDHDWTARFFSDIQDVSNHEAQLLYARILAGEVERPGSTSMRTLTILKNLDMPTAQLFGVLRSGCMSVYFDYHHSRAADARVLALGFDATQNALRKFGLSFENLNVLNEHGLIIPDYRSWYDVRMCIGTIATNDKQEQQMVRVPFEFEDRHWILEPASSWKMGSEYRVSGVALTGAGRELLRVVECRPIPGYRDALTDFFASQEMTMTETDGGVQIAQISDELVWRST